MNSFLQLQEEDKEFFVQEYEKDIRTNVESRLKTIYLISDVLEHFVPIFSDTLTVLAGGSVIDPEDTYLTIDEEDGSPSLIPGTPEGDDVIR
jgi:hypothetical protein